MGLDMYLYKRTYIRSANHYKQDDRQIVEVKPIHGVIFIIHHHGKETRY